MADIGKLERVPLREVWRHEALDFTSWLQENLDLINDQTQLALASAEREQSAGSFNVDLLATGESGATVVIENQLERSDHDHLGKLITYLSAFDADAAVWICSDPRPEHVAAVAWLNESSPADFYLAKIEAVRIEGSPPAPLLTMIVEPSEEARAVGAVKKERSELGDRRSRYWRSLLAVANEKTSLHANISPSRDHWISASAGVAGLTFSYIIGTRGECRVELMIRRESTEATKQLFDAWYDKRDEIQADFGAELGWERLDDRKGSRIKYDLELGGLNEDEERWPQIQAAQVAAMVRLENAFRPHLDRLSKSLR